MVGVPLTHPHSKRVDILVQLIQESNALDDHVVGSVDVELDLAPGVGMAKTKLGFSRGFRCQGLDQLVKVEPDATDNLRNNSNMTHFDSERLGESSSKLRVKNSKNNLLQFLGEIGFQKVLKLQYKGNL